MEADSEMEKIMFIFYSFEKASRTRTDEAGGRRSVRMRTKPDRVTRASRKIVGARELGREMASIGLGKGLQVRFGGEVEGAGQGACRWLSDAKSQSINDFQIQKQNGLAKIIVSIRTERTMEIVYYLNNCKFSVT